MLWYYHMCLFIVFSGERCGPWVSCFPNFGVDHFVIIWSKDKLWWGRLIRKRTGRSVYSPSKAVCTLKVDCIAVLASRTSTSSMFCDYSTCLHCYLKIFPTLHGWEYCRYGVKLRTIKRISTRNILISKPAKNISVLDMKDVFLSKCNLWSKNTFCML